MSRVASGAKAPGEWRSAQPAKRSVLLVAAQTKPVVDYYAKQGLYSPIDANQKFDTVKAAIAAILK